MHWMDFNSVNQEETHYELTQSLGDLEQFAGRVHWLKDGEKV